MMVCAIFSSLGRQKQQGQTFKAKVPLSYIRSPNPVPDSKQTKSFLIIYILFSNTLTIQKKILILKT